MSNKFVSSLVGASLMISTVAEARPAGVAPIGNPNVNIGTIQFTVPVLGPVCDITSDKNVYTATYNHATGIIQSEMLNWTYEVLSTDASRPKYLSAGVWDHNTVASDTFNPVNIHVYDEDVSVVVPVLSTTQWYNHVVYKDESGDVIGGSNASYAAAYAITDTQVLHKGTVEQQLTVIVPVEYRHLLRSNKVYKIYSIVGCVNN